MPAARRIARLFARLALLAAAASGSLARAEEPPERKRDLSKDKVLYCVGYAHLDTQWRWDYTTTIDEYVRATLEDNFALMDRYPGYAFNFTGSARYAMMKEYYPQQYERLKGLIANGRWFVSGSSVDEGDVNVPSAEAVLRQVLYGNQFFRREFGKESVDFMLPDCFGFPASMPSIWAHAGLRGFSTQKLSWGSAVGIPFKVGRWIGPDGRGVVAALDPGSYATGLTGRVDLHPGWVARVEENGAKYGVFADYHYYGTGDQGGAPREDHVAAYTGSVDQPDSRVHVELGSSDQMFRDLTDEQAARLPAYSGDMLLTQHSAGSLTSQAYMKRWNRKGELLADAAERAAVGAEWFASPGGYPFEMLNRSWERLLANQMHDILPGTSLPRAYTFSWNDEIVAQLGFASVLTDSIGGLAQAMNTQARGVPVLVYNPLAIEREDPVEAEVIFDGPAPRHVAVIGPDGREAPSQVLSRDPSSVRVLFLARVPSVGLASFDVRPAAAPWRAGAGTLSATASRLENDEYAVTIGASGDIESVRDVRNGRELLRAPARWVFTGERPGAWPAWNMDWEDRQRPPLGALDGPARIRVVEAGPVRATVEVTRSARDSTVTQRISLLRGGAGRRVEVACHVDWQSAAVALRATFPLTVANEQATYNWGLGTIRRGNNEPAKYEVPSHEWMDLTDSSGDYGVSILEDCKFGSDKPDDSTLRLTLLYTPGVRKSYQDQHSQDWGRHDFTYALYGHRGDSVAGQSEWQGRRLNQPLRAFQVKAHEGPLGREICLAQVDTPQVDVRALKRAEDSPATIVRLQELWGRPTGDVAVSFPREVANAWEVDGQERRIGPARVRDGKLVVDMTAFSPRSFAIELAPDPSGPPPRPQATPLRLDFDTDIVSTDARRSDGRLDGAGRTLPAEQLPAAIACGGLSFTLGPTTDGAANALTCRGQRLALPAGTERVELLVTSTEDVEAAFAAGSSRFMERIPSWTGFLGQWDDRTWDVECEKVDHTCPGHVTGFRPGYIKNADVAWFATHRHHPTLGNEAYRFSYLYRVALDVPAGARDLRLPDDPNVKVLAVTAARDVPALARPAAPLLDDFSQRGPLALRHVYPEPEKPVFESAKPAGRVTIDRSDSFDALSVGAPSGTDFADSSQGHGLSFRVHDGDGAHRPHPASGVVDGTFPRLHDGQVARNDDDTDGCVWYDTEGRFSIDLGAVRRVDRVATYSWHRLERAPQWFSLWGSAADVMPSPDFTRGHADGWTLLGVVDTRALGQGGKHGSSVAFDLPVRHLLFVTQDVGNGTFFTEVDVHVRQ